MSLLSEEREEQVIKKSVREQYGRCQGELERALEVHEVLLKEWKRTGDEETGRMRDEAYKEVQRAREDRNLLAAVLLSSLIDNGII